ncbi:hypothetical protein H5407_05790 [Mitsuaria sp. WAJ17]|uniref:hypothetical protein n=1 Tax=Mitsuaria sp. WAJ17 TaxID=2761452 RepID=UPI001601859F|nr:hypothetical protein [Mitsuaria sp. WAJ17]MBB2484735.1 hypothetical protein [Mitsuaria sp. WAJ17]
MQLGPSNSEMQRSLTVGAFSVLMPFVVMGLLRWAWRAKRWLLALWLSITVHLTKQRWRPSLHIGRFRRSFV